MRKNYNYTCKECSERCVRNGKVGKKQRWKCKSCGITQFRVYKRCTITPDRATIIKRLNHENVGIRGISRLIGISPTHVVRCILQLASLVERPDNYEYGQEYELDEMWSYVGNKEVLCYI